MHAQACLQLTMRFCPAEDGVSPHLSIGERARIIPKISKSDEAFAKECIDFVWGHEDINISELNDLFERVRTHHTHTFASLAAVRPALAHTCVNADEHGCACSPARACTEQAPTKQAS